MLSEQVLKKIEELAAEVAARESCIIYDIEFISGSRILRVYIDKQEATAGGAGIDDCEKVSNGLNLMLDVDDVIPGGAYNLEVSTPGLERPLKKAWHFKQAEGKKILVRLNRSLESFGMTDKKYKSLKNFEEILKEANESEIKFLIGDQEISVPFTAVDKARMVFEIVKGEKHNPKQRGNHGR